MPKQPEAPLRKVTLNLFEADCAALEKHYGWGWSETVRTLVQGHAATLKPTPRRTIGDLHRE